MSVIPPRMGLTGMLLVAGGLVAACADRSAGVTGRFELVRTQAGELPTLLGEVEGCRHHAVGGSVELKRDSTYTAELHRRRLCEPHALNDSITTADTTFVDPGGGTYVIEGDSLFFRFPGGSSAGSGVVRGDTLVVEGPGQTLFYRRAAPR